MGRLPSRAGKGKRRLVPSRQLWIVINRLLTERQAAAIGLIYLALLMGFALTLVWLMSPYLADLANIVGGLH